MKETVLHIPAKAPFSFDECRWFLNRNLDDCMLRIDGNLIRKAMTFGRKNVLLEISGNEQGLSIRTAGQSLRKAEAAELEHYVRYWFDTDRDLRPFYKLLSNYEPLAWMPAAFSGLRLIAMPDLFETLAWAVTGQQINLSFAYKLKRRLVERYGKVLLFNDQPYYLFPTPEMMADADVADLRAMQFSTGKAAYLTGIAKAFVAGELNIEILQALPDVAARQEALKSIRGIGTWTANYALMKCLREPTSVPYGDAGLHNALKAAGIIKDKTETAEIQQLFDRFRGWEGYLVFYLWRSLSVPQE